MSSLLDSVNKGLFVAMDHASAGGVVPGLEDPARLLGDSQPFRAWRFPTGIMTTYGVIKRYAAELRAIKQARENSTDTGDFKVVLRLDGGPSRFLEDWLEYTEWGLLHSVDTAVRLRGEGLVDGVCVMGFLGSKVETITFGIVAQVAEECRRAGLPLMVEALPCRGPRIPDPLNADAMASAARIAFERGADVIKTYYTGSVESFQQVTRNCPIPVLVAGGARLDNPQDAVNLLRDSIRGGARGAVFGRNIWQNERPLEVMRSLWETIIHTREE